MLAFIEKYQNIVENNYSHMNILILITKSFKISIKMSFIIDQIISCKVTFIEIYSSKNFFYADINSYERYLLVINSFKLICFHNQFDQKDYKTSQMTALSLSQRLIHLRGMIADSLESTLLLKEVDLLISFEKHLKQERKDQTIDQLQLKLKKENEKNKQLLKDKKQLQVVLDNLKCDLEITIVKCQNLQTKVKEFNKKEGRQRRVQSKQNIKKTREIQVQVDTLSQQMLDDALRCYKKELKENEILRNEVDQLRKREDLAKIQLSLHQTTITEQQDMDQEINNHHASFLQQLNQQAFYNNNIREDSVLDQKQDKNSFLNLLWIKSKQIMTYFKDQ